MTGNGSSSNSDRPARRRRLRVVVGVSIVALLAFGVGIVLIVGVGDSPSAVTSPRSQSAGTNEQMVAADQERDLPTERPTRLLSPHYDSSSPRPTKTAGEEVRANDAKLANTPQKTKKPVRFTEMSRVEKGISAKISNIEPVKGVAKLPGEVAGPALRFTVTVSNSTSEPISTRDALVNVSVGKDNIPAVPLSGPGASALPPMIKSDGSASATYVYNVPIDERGRVKIQFNLRVSSPIAVFTGSAPEPGDNDD